MNKRLSNILEYLWILVIILETNTVYNQLVKINFYFKYISTILGILLILVKGKKIKINKNKFAILFVYFSGLVVISKILKVKLNIIFINFFANFFILFCYFSTYGKKAVVSFAKKFIKIICILAIISLFFWVFADILKIIPSTGRIEINWGIGSEYFPKTYYFIHFDTQYTKIINNSIPKNNGIFCEAPMYSLVLTIALMFELFITEIKKSKKVIILLIITILTTTSTTGSVLTIIMCFLYYIFFSANNTFYKFIKILLIPLLVFGIVISIKIIMLNKSTTGSYSHRMLDYENGFNIFLKSPIFGKGINHKRPDGALRGYGFSNSIVRVLGDGGIYLTLFYGIALLRMIWFGNKMKKSNYYCMALVCFILYCVTIFPYKVLMMCLLSIVYSIKNENKEIKNEI